jgi:putative DNA primase/helicase
VADSTGPTPTPEEALPPPPAIASIEDARRRKAEASPAAATPPPVPEGANSRPEGTGGGKGDKSKKPGKTIDWGKYNSLLANFALIYGTDTVWDGANRLIMKISNMAHAHGSDMVKMWKGSETRRTVFPENVVFDPTETCDKEACVNLFGGIELEPAKGDVEPFLRLGRFLTSRASDDADECDQIFHWLLCWLAYPLQRPGSKLRTAIVMHGDEGAGKNFFFECVLEIYGRYGALVGQDELEDKFNDWRSGKCMVIGDEVSSRQELVHNKNRLKALITSPTVQINPKNLPRREEKNHINIVFLSNELQPLALDNSDRRYLVVYTPRMKDRPFYEDLKNWKDGGGVAALYSYLLAYPIDDFDPYAPAPTTQAKQDLIELNRKSPERFWIEWASNELDLPYRSCSSEQAYRAYTKYAQRVGDRWPLQRNVFTRMVLRISETGIVPGAKPVREKVMRVAQAALEPDQPASISSKAMRMLLVTDPPSDAQGEWASECVRAFDLALRDYLGWHAPHSPGDESTGKPEGGKGAP